MFSRQPKPIVLNHGVEQPQEHEIDKLKAKYKKRHTIGVIAILFMLGGMVGTSLMYYSAANTVADQTDEIASLNEKVESAKIILSGKEKDTIDGEQPTEGGETPGQEVSKCDSGSEYTGKVGKFTIKLDAPNVVIEELDGKYEGGPATIIEVAQCKPGQLGVYSNSVFKNIKVNARPADLTSATDLVAELKSNWGDAFNDAAISSVTVGGAEAKVYKVNLLGLQRVVLFEKNGVSYRIDINEDDKNAEDLLTDLISDWKFTN